jgi:putative peptide zinc metalloprotease protein
MERLRWQTSAGTFDGGQRAQWQVSQEQLSAAHAEAAAIQADTVRYEPKAPFPGVLRDLAADLRPGTWLTPREPLARLIADQGQMAVTYLDEDDVSQLSVGGSAKFYADGSGGPVVPLEVVSIDPDASRVLPEPELATFFGGSIMAREKNAQFYPEHPIYRVILKTTASVETGAQHTWRGKIVISGHWTAPGWRYLRTAMALIRREAGF